MNSPEIAASRKHAEWLDANDPLSDYRNQFLLPEGLIYLDGNSLGALPCTTPDRLREVVARQWGERLIRAWDEGWLDQPVGVGARLGALLGAAPGELIIGDSTTVCLYKLASAALELRPGRPRIVTDFDNFPTDRYVLEGVVRERGAKLEWLHCDRILGPCLEDVASVIDTDTALVTFSHVSYRSASVADMAGINRMARDAGALTLWDLSHSAGSVPVALDDDGADLAVGCTYKYLNGGPGAPAFMYVSRELLGELDQPIWGWLGRRDPFAMEPGYVPADDIRRVLSGSPPVLALAAVEEGIRLVAEAGMQRVHAKAMALTDFAIALVDARLEKFGFSIASPRDRLRRGAHVAVAHPDARDLCAALIAREVIVDFRRPNLIRIGLSPLTTRFVDVWDAIDLLVTLAT
ncbi:MAG: kynureninase [Solirubrobacteraceae bacterium]